MYRNLLITAIVVLIVTSSYVKADPVSQKDVMQAQFQMLNRVSTTVNQYAEKIGMDPAWISYCRSQMRLQTFQHPTDGAIPFGVNYNSITDSETLDNVIYARESFERGYLILCLARTKNELVEADKP